MVAVEPLERFVELLIWTGAVEGERPVSAIIIAPAGAGKTSVLERMDSPVSPFTNDLTSREVHSILQRCPQAHHLLIGDFLNVLAHKTSVVTLTLRTMAALTGDTLYVDPYDGSKIDRKLGVITAIPPEDFKKRKVQNHFSSGGLGSRFIMAKYSYKPGTVVRIHRWIQGDKYAASGNHRHYNLPDPQLKPHAVVIPEAVAVEINSLAQQLKKDPLGTRMHHHLRALVKAQALRMERVTATRTDLETVMEYADFFSGSGKEL